MLKTLQLSSPEVGGVPLVFDHARECQDTWSCILNTVKDSHPR